MEKMKPLHSRVPNSSNIASIGYDPNVGALDVEYHDGGTWRYHGVPLATHHAALLARSTGGFIAAQVKGKYRATRV